MSSRWPYLKKFYLERAMGLFDKLATVSRWNRLRIIGNSHIAQSALAVPIIGYFILFNSYIIEYLKLHTAFCQGVACDVSWRLYFLYFGACGFALGSGIYGIFCPPLVKKYPGASDFFEAEKGYFTQPSNLDYLFKLIEQAKGAGPADPYNLRREIAENNPISTSRINALAGVMGEHYVLQIYSRPYLRVCVLLAYGAGSVLLLIPTIITFMQVLSRALWTVVNRLN